MNFQGTDSTDTEYDFNMYLLNKLINSIEKSWVIFVCFNKGTDLAYDY